MRNRPRAGLASNVARTSVATAVAFLLAHGSVTLAQDGPALERSLQEAERATPGRPTLDRFFSKTFDATQWVDLLSSEDLDRREESYRLLLRRARVDPAVRAFLEELARDTTRSELAWTARLGLRELSLHDSYRRQSALQLFDFDSQMQRMLGEMMGEYPGLHLAPPTAGGDAPEGASVLVRTDVLGVFVPRLSAAEEADPTQRRPGLLVSRIEPGTIAHRMGIGTGDILLRINGRDMRVPADITETLRERARHEPVTVDWLDDLNTMQSTTWTPDPVD